MTRIAIIERELCLKEKCGYVCQKVCPGVLMGDETVTVDADGYPIISEVLCTGCGICPKKCPANCITIINLAEEHGKPMHQYGVNMFRLYGMPMPQNEGVVGLIGKNGIGKSTALKILAQSIVPNFGEYEKKWEWKDSIARMSLEHKKYFSPVVGKKVKVALKPQNVDKIAGAFFGKVEDLLRKADERKAFDEAVSSFSLQQTLGKNISEVSGGELQRIALAACFVRDADIYYFDEPATFLDIEQRLAAAAAIKRLAEKKRVIVVEHDLAVFDYLSDYVYVFFGQENAYGAVSGLKNARAGVNEYLGGYLKAENIRFRETEIKFPGSESGDRKSDVKFTYPALKKTYPGFSFSSDSGEIRKGEIVGILGKNAIGKSLFVKMLAGAEVPDSGKMEQKLSVSYKPQHIRAEEAVRVADIFLREKLDMFTLEQAKRRLSVNSLMENDLDKLSGGELQRVAITLALSRPAEVYLFDEPSAFLDVEQRLHFSQLLRSIIEGSDKCAFVIDHDMVLADSISSRVMVFEGIASKEGHVGAPSSKREGLNAFLKGFGITVRRDRDSHRPRINKPGSALDREQKEAGQYYYWKS
jgi:ATP-binding cassette subfamily E protein 1